MTFTLGHMTFGGTIIMVVHGRPTVETPGGAFIVADNVPGGSTGEGDGI